jgi:Myo-inositol oxygenase
VASLIPKRLIKAALARRGYEVRPITPVTRDVQERAAFTRTGNEIQRRHRAQTREQVAALRAKYARPVIGLVNTWDLLEQLGACIDPTDTMLYGASQQLHVLQVLAAMEADGVKDPVLLAAALIHDVGKVLLLTGEAPENVVCVNAPIGEHATACGLDQAWLQWNHDEFGWSRVKDEVEEPVAWLVRYHSIIPDRCAPLFDARDRAYAERYLVPFRHYDQNFKSPFSLPRKRLADYRDLATQLLPATLVM